MCRLRHRRCADERPADAAAGKAMCGVVGEAAHRTSGEATCVVVGEAVHRTSGEAVHRAVGEAMCGADLVQNRASRTKPRLPGSAPGRNVAGDSGGLGWRRAGSTP
jgi:hypothetical protein